MLKDNKHEGIELFQAYGKREGRLFVIAQSEGEEKRRTNRLISFIMRIKRPNI